MTLFLWGAGGTSENFPTRLGNELFHCVQYDAEPRSDGDLRSDGCRWIEGSAEAFAAHAIVNSWQTTTVDDDGATTVNVTGTAGRSTGRWSILGPGRLAGCADTTGATVAEGAVEGPNVSGSVALFGPPGGGDEGSVAYSCGDGATTTQVQMGRFGEVEFPFTRLSPPPEE